MDYRKECERLRSQLASAEKANARALDRTPHPNAREREQEGDWLCSVCLFKSNRFGRQFCYRCTAPRCESFGPSSRMAPAGTPALSGGPPLVLAPGGALGQQPTYAAVAAAAPRSPIVVAASTCTHAAAPGAQSSSGQPPHETAKALRGTLEKLQAARSALAGDLGCGETAKQLDDRIAATRGQLAACLPVEVAVKGTIGPAAQARQAVVKAEAKLNRLEQQVAATVAAYDAAAAELAACRTTLQEAEAATARAAAVALPRSDVERVLSNDPAAVWAAMVAFIKDRVSGMPPELVAHIGAATDAFQAACAQLPADPVKPVPPKAEQEGSAAMASGAQLPAVHEHPHPAPAPLLRPSSPAVPSHFEAAAAAADQAACAAAAAAAADHASSATAAAGAGAAATAGGGGPAIPADAEAQRLREALAAAQRDWDHHVPVTSLVGSSPAAAAAAQGDPGPGAQPAVAGRDDGNAVPTGGGGGGGATLHDDDDADLAVATLPAPGGAAAAPRDDPMGGTAAEGVVGKRPVEEAQTAVERARSVAAKAKARAA
jgi:hypothetical protein